MAQRGGTAKVTTDHEFIRDWVERRGGCPATVKRPGRARTPGLIQIDYPGRRETPRPLLPISWDEFFDRFEQHKLAFVYQDAKVRGQPRRISQFVERSSIVSVGDDVVIGRRIQRRRRLRATGSRRSGASSSPDPGRTG